MQVPALLAGQITSKAKQAAMVALGALASAHGKTKPAAILTTIPSVLIQVGC